MSVKYKRKEYFETRDVAGDMIILARGKEALTFNGVLVPNESFMILWNKLKNFCSINELASELVDVYLIDFDTARKDVVKCVDKMMDNKLLQVELME